MIDSRDFAALPENLRRRCALFAKRSATEERDLDQWWSERPRSLLSLIRGKQQTLYLLRADHNLKGAGELQKSSG